MTSIFLSKILIAFFVEGSIQNWTNRVIYAILTLEKKYIRWPSQEERGELKRRIGERSFFRDCIGFVDGTLIPLATAPRENPEKYWTRKFFYAFNVMLVCDIDRRVIYYELGFSGSAHDQRVFRSTKVSKTV